MNVTISAMAHAAIRANAIGEFRDTATRNPDGTYSLELDPEVVERLARIAPDPSDAILIACTRGRRQ